MPKVQHVVLMRFKPDTRHEAIAGAMQDLSRIREKIPGLIDFTWGPDASTEGLARGFTHAFVMTFADTNARDEYLPHPEHEAVKIKLLELLDGGVEGVIILDYEA